MAGLDVIGVVINYHKPPEGTLAELTNPQALEELMPVPIIGVIPYLKDMDKLTLEKTAFDVLDIKVLNRTLRL
jgi:dethiobiotin synthetase